MGNFNFSEIIKNLRITYLWYAKEYKGNLIKIAFMSLFITVFGVINPKIVAEIIENFEQKQFDILYYLIAAGGCCYFAWDILRFRMDQKVVEVSNGILTKLRSSILPSMLQLSNSSFEKETSGTYLERIQDADNVSFIFHKLNSAFLRIATECFVFVMIFSIHKTLGCYLLFFTGAIIALQYRKGKAVTVKDEIFKSSKDRTMGVFKEIVNGLREVKSFGNDEHIIDNFTKSIKTQAVGYMDKFSTKNRYGFYTNMMFSFMWTSTVIMICTLCAVHEISVPSAIALFIYIGNIGNIGFVCQDLVDDLEAFNLSLNRIISLSDDSKFPKEQFGNLAITNLVGTISFNHVGFSYDKDDNEKSILKDFSCEIPAGSTIALVGASGAGKSTIFNLLCKFYDPDKGSILIDGHRIETLTKDTIRKGIALISQSPVIFNKSIIDSFKDTKPDITLREIMDVCQKVQLDRWIRSLKDGYNSIIGENGINMSGGQRQRLAIARSLVKGSKILLFDEATSALDGETQEEIKNLITSLKNDHTILIIAHRMSTIADCDKIIVLDSGKIADQGSFDNLMYGSAVFQKLMKHECKWAEKLVVHHEEMTSTRKGIDSLIA